MNRERNQFVEDRRLETCTRKNSASCKKRAGFRFFFDGRQVERIVFKARMVAHQQESEYGESSESRARLARAQSPLELRLDGLGGTLGHSSLNVTGSGLSKQAF